MAEIKRTFTNPGINRDLDDRLLPNGMYRDALNVNVGRSEGDDVGAIENLKGNISIDPNTLVISGDGVTTIGVIRDPDNARIYWLNTGRGYDAIYEYDEDTNRITPILSEPKTREVELPTCAPELLARITDPEGNRGTRATLNPLPDPPTPVCNTEFGPNGRMNTNYVANVGSGQYASNAVCIEAPPPPTPATDPVAVITGLTVGITGGDAVALSGTSSTPGTATGGAAATITTYAWSTSSSISGYTSQTGSGSTFSVTAPSTDGSVVVTLTITNSEGATDDTTHTITYSSTAPTTYSLNVSSSTDITGATATGASTQTLTEGATITAVSSGVSVIDTTNNEFPGGFGGTATLVAAAGSTSGFTLTQTGATAVLTGTMPAEDTTLSIEWSGDTVEARPATPTTTTYTINPPSNGNPGFDFNSNIAFTRTGAPGAISPSVTKAFRTQAGAGEDFNGTPNLTFDPALPAGSTVAYTSIARSTGIDITGEIYVATITITEQPAADTTIAPTWNDIGAGTTVSGDTGATIRCATRGENGDMSGTVTVEGSNADISVTVSNGGLGGTATARLTINGTNYESSRSGTSPLGNTEVSAGVLPPGEYDWTFTIVSALSCSGGSYLGRGQAPSGSFAIS